MTVAMLKHSIFAGLCLTTSVGVGMAQTVTVQPGDALSIIAERELGTVGAWRELCKVNSVLLNGNCNLIEPGMVLQLPGADTGAAPVAGATLIVNNTPDPEPAKAAVFTVPLNFKGPQGYSAQASGTGVTLSGHVAGATSGGRPGISVRIPDAAEQAASANRVRVSVTLTSASPTTVLASYSTADVGNSGWRELTATPQGRTQTFEYKVPKIKNGNGDFIGFQPDPANTGQSVTISDMRVEILPAGN